MAQRQITGGTGLCYMLDWLREEEGAVLCEDAQYMSKLKAALVEIFALLPDLLPDLQAQGLVSFVLYRQRDQRVKYIMDADGMCWFKDTTRGRLYALGIATEAIDWGQDYLKMVILHEVSHQLYGGPHDNGFHTFLDDLIRQFWVAGGECEPNDRAGLPMRHDSMPWTPPPFPEDFRKDQQDSCRVFRTSGLPV